MRPEVLEDMERSAMFRARLVIERNQRHSDLSNNDNAGVCSWLEEINRNLLALLSEMENKR